ncbi:MAG TPA: SDR family NAD(P)-dependent oxidoreductase [Kofleriaceae bacterium]
MKDVKDKVAVVTGAASGIGRGMAEVFADAGMKVVLSDIEQPALERTCSALRASGADVHAVATDVSRPEQVEQLAEQTLRTYGAVHVLCNNAGVGGSGGGQSWTSSLKDWQWILGVNLMGVVHGIRTFLPIMIKQDTEAHIVNTASLAGLVPSVMTLYCTTKFAVVGLSESVNLELIRGGLKPKISVLCPGWVDTNILDSQRNRPAELANDAPAPVTPVGQAIREWVSEQLKQGLTPRAVGEQVLAAIRDERFYILTHPSETPVIEQRMRDIVRGNNPALLPILGIESLMKRLGALNPAAR